MDSEKLTINVTPVDLGGWTSSFATASTRTAQI